MLAEGRHRLLAFLDSLRYELRFPPRKTVSRLHGILDKLERLFGIFGNDRASWRNRGRLASAE
jgi:hypothetical protein